MGYQDLRWLTDSEVQELRERVEKFGYELGKQYMGLISVERNGLPLETSISRGFTRGVADEFDKLRIAREK